MGRGNKVILMATIIIMHEIHFSYCDPYLFWTSISKKKVAQLYYHNMLARCSQLTFK